MLTYNTQQKKLVLPEYGRNIQQMIDHCGTVEDRDERTRCAQSIVAAMGTLFPAMRETDEGRRKLWDHLAIMSGFTLDVDYPFEVIKPDDINPKPQPVEYPAQRIRFRHYGKDVERAIDCAVAMEEGEERDALVYMVASHMKKLLLAISPDGVPDEKVFRDLAQMSKGQLLLYTDTTQLPEFNIVAPPSQGKRRKKKRN